MAGRIERMSDRCKRICGSADRHCYIHRNEQISCIADIVINKTAGISMFLGMSLKQSGAGAGDEYVRESISASNELSNWIKYLQLAGNLRELSSLVLDANPGEKRTEIRYPLPEAHSIHIAAHVGLPGYNMPVAVAVTNFSQSGVQLKCPEPLETGTRVDGRVFPALYEDRETPFGAVIKYCAKHEGGHLVGARVVEVSGGTTFNFFNSIYRCITEGRIAEGKRLYIPGE
jgi:hypothetical protein